MVWCVCVLFVCDIMTYLHGCETLYLKDVLWLVPDWLFFTFMFTCSSWFCLFYYLSDRSSVLWHCWLGIRKSIWPVKTEWLGAGMDRSANDLHMFQLMPLPPHHLLLHCKSEWFDLLIPGFPVWKRPWNKCCCCACLTATLCNKTCQMWTICFILCVYFFNEIFLLSDQH